MTDEAVIESQQIPGNKLKAGWQLIKITFVEWWNDNTFELAAALAFYTSDVTKPGSGHIVLHGRSLS